jgi:CMP/dCMP kinase
MASDDFSASGNVKHIITIAGRPGSGKSTVAKEVAAQLGFRHFSSGDLFRKLARQSGVSDLTRAMRDPAINHKLDRLVDSKLREIGQKENNIVIDSRTAWHWIPESFKVFLDLDLRIAAQRIWQDISEHRKTSEEIPANSAAYAKTLEERVKTEAIRFRDQYGINPFDMRNYDLVIDTAVNNQQQVAKKVIKAYKNRLKD